MDLLILKPKPVPPPVTTATWPFTLNRLAADNGDDILVFRRLKYAEGRPTMFGSIQP